jgi:predicted DNA binding CopG/RHH family protein
MAKARTNYKLDEDLVKRVKIKCIKLGVSMTKVITELLEGWVK